MNKTAANTVPKIVTSGITFAAFFNITPWQSAVFQKPTNKKNANDDALIKPITPVSTKEGAEKIAKSKYWIPKSQLVTMPKLSKAL